MIAAVVLVGAGSAVAIASTASGGPSLRVASVVRGSVTETVESSGTVSSSSKSVLSFPVSGTVSSVRVKIGDAVKAGQTLAELDTTSLQSGVDAARTSLASA